MASYEDLFDSYAVGSSLPAGWTSRWDGGSWSVVDAAGDKFLRQLDTVASRYLASWNAIDADANRANADVVGIVSSHSALASNAHAGVACRCSGTGTTETGYVACLYGPQLAIVRYLNGAGSTLVATTGLSLSADTKYRIRLSAQGTAIKAKVWLDGSAEPGTWNLSVTNSEIASAGWIGCFGFAYIAPDAPNNHDFYAMAAGTNGDIATFAGPKTLTAPLIASGGALYAPSVSVAGSAQTLTAPLIASTEVLHTPSVTGSSSTQSITPPLIASTSAVYAPALQGIHIKADYERSSVNLSGSSVSGAGDAAVISIKPRVQESEYLTGATAWYEPSAKVIGVNNVRPTFKFLDYASAWSAGKYLSPPWGATRKPMFSYDRLTWNYFDTVTVNATDITFRHNTAFTSGTVYLSKDRQVSVNQVGLWVEGLAADYPAIVEPTATSAAFTPALVAWPAQTFIADEFSPQVDELGQTIPATPFYALQINDTGLMPTSGVKKTAVLVCGVHAGEDSAFWPFREAISTILGDSATGVYLRKHFKILIYPMLNAPGRAGGGWRGSFTQGVGGADDANRHFSEASPGLETVTKPRTAMVTDMGGTSPAWMFDFHNTSSPTSQWGSFIDNAKQLAFNNVVQAQSGITHADLGDTPAQCVSRYFQDTAGVSLALSFEYGGLYPVTDATFASYGVSFAESVAAFFQTVEALLIASSSQIFTPSLALSPVAVEFPVISSTEQVFTPSLVSGEEISAPRIESTASLYSPQITVGSVSVAAPLIGGTSHVFSPALAAGAQTVSMPTLASTLQLFSPVLNLGAVQISMPLLPSSNAFFAPNVIGGDVGLASEFNSYSIQPADMRFSVAQQNINYSIER